MLTGCTAICAGAAPPYGKGVLYPVMLVNRSLYSEGAVHLARVGTPDPPDTKGSIRAVRAVHIAAYERLA